MISIYILLELEKQRKHVHERANTHRPREQKNTLTMIGKDMGPTSNTSFYNKFTNITPSYEYHQQQSNNL